MNLFKKTVNQNDFIKIIYQLGYDRYIFLKEQFKNELNYKDTLLFLLTITVTSSLTKRILKFNNISFQYDIVNEVNKIVDLAFQDENAKNTMITYFVYVKEEIWEIIDNDDGDSVNKLANYFINEITAEQNKDITVRQYMINIFADWHFETKNILKNIKLK